jgi:competence protein ComFC
MSFDFIANIFFPPVCLVCRTRVARGVICDACFAGIFVRSGFLCGECHAFLPNAATICHFDFPYLLGAAGNYDDAALQSLIHHLKFRSIKGAAEPLAALLFTYLERTKIDLADYIVVPIPLSRRRARSRGFNQAELIAGHLAAALGLPLQTKSLARTIYAKPQSDIIDVARRKENVRGGFAVVDRNAERPGGGVHGKNILLIDDVSTTGATFFEASLALKAAGVKHIIAIAAAKT